jgi:predicted O-methyltransferase YrrM
MLLIGILTLQFATLALVVVLYRRIRRKQFDSEDRVVEQLNTVYTQVEALLALRGALALNDPLPATRGWAASPDFLVHLVREARTRQPQVIVECSSGTSTVVLARMVQANGHGHVYSLEHDALYAAKTRQALVSHGLDAFATVIDAPLRSHRIGSSTWMWYDTSALPRDIDMLVIDGPPATTQALARYPAVPLLRSTMSAACLIVLDDAARPDEQAAVARWIADDGMELRTGYYAEKGIAVLAPRAVAVG